MPLSSSSGPVRICRICYKKNSKNLFIRIVRKPDGIVVVDPKGDVPGRGVYICHDEKCLSQLSKKNVQKSLRFWLKAQWDLSIIHKDLKNY